MSDAELLIWIERGQLIATLLVAIGVAGEFAGSFIARPINSRLEAVRQDELTRLNQGIADSNARVKEFEAGIADARARAAEANKIAEEERLKRVEIEAKLAPRTMDPKQIADLAIRLQMIGKRDVDVMVHGETPEMVRIGQSIVLALTNAGWNIKAWTVTSGGIAVTGIVVAVNPNADAGTKQAAQKLLEALHHEGLWVISWTPPDWTALSGLMNGPPLDKSKLAPIRILIGTKP